VASFNLAHPVNHNFTSNSEDRLEYLPVVNQSTKTNLYSARAVSCYWTESCRRIYLIQVFRFVNPFSPYLLTKLVPSFHASDLIFLTPVRDQFFLFLYYKTTFRCLYHEPHQSITNICISHWALS